MLVQFKMKNVLSFKEESYMCHHSDSMRKEKS